MNCEQLQQDIPLYVVGALDADEHAEITRHLATGCPACTAALAEANAVAAHLPLALQQDLAPETAREKLLGRVRNSKASAAKLTAEPKRLAPHLRWAVVVAGVIVCGVIAIGAAWFSFNGAMQEREDRIAELQTQLKARDVEIQLLEAELSGARDTLVALNSRELNVVSLDRQPAQPDTAWGRILWDEDNRRWHVAVGGMKPAGQGKTYELWFVTAAGDKIAADTFDVNDRGFARLQVDLPDDLGELSLAAVTDEPAGGSTQPTGSFQMVGKIQ